MGENWAKTQTFINHGRQSNFDKSLFLLCLLMSKEVPDRMIDFLYKVPRVKEAQ